MPACLVIRPAFRMRVTISPGPARPKLLSCRSLLHKGDTPCPPTASHGRRLIREGVKEETERPPPLCSEAILMPDRHSLLREQSLRQAVS
ncbi:MAG: hypothetical protein D6740_01600 [Alphaproteobacteria bacterium]|nr:MAG: hypothetical protein D6740_01600 [Alphaproteobacteria bacterium]